MTESVSTDDGDKQVTVLTEATYEFFKKLVQLILPAFSSLYFGLAQIWGLPAAEKVVGTAALVTTFLGVILKISTTRYNNSDLPHNGEFVVTEDPGGASGFKLVLNDDPEALKDRASISFKVKKIQE